MSIETITECIPRCVQHFDRENYAEEFDRFCGICREYFSVPRPSFADEFMEYTQHETKKRIGRGSKLFDLHIFLCVYLCPAAELSGGEAVKSAAELNSCWNSRYPQYSFETGSYKDIASGFRTKPFGF